MPEKKIVDYCLVSAVWNSWAHEWRTKSLTENVREMIKAGWQPLGGVSCYEDKNNCISYCQAMVKYK